MGDVRETCRRVGVSAYRRVEELHKRLYERVLEAELTHYLGYGKGEAPEQAEGQRRETIATAAAKKRS